MFVLTPLFLLTFSACSTERVITQPEVVEVVRVERVTIPPDLLVLHNPTTLPEALTYGEALQLWAEDRSIIKTLLGQLQAIESLNGEDNGNSE